MRIYLYSISLRLKQRVKKMFCFRRLNAPLRHVIVAQLRDANVGLPVTSLLAVVY